MAGGAGPRTRKFAREKKQITGSMVAAIAGVSQSTVVRVLQGDPRISPVTTRRVLEIARKTHYIPDKHSSLRILMLLDEPFFDAYTATWLEILWKEILRRGWSGEIVRVTDMEQLRYASGGIAFCNMDQWADEWEERVGIPLIVYGWHGHRTHCIFPMTADGKYDMELVIDRLWRCGHRRIGLLCNHSRKDEAACYEHRAAGFIEASASRGVGDCESRMLFWGEGGSLRKRLETQWNQGVTALVVIPGDYTIQILAELKKMRVRVPEDLSLISWEYATVLPYLEPAVTALEPGVQQFVTYACDYLEAMVTRQVIPPDIQIRGLLQERASVAPPLIRSENNTNTMK